MCLTTEARYHLWMVELAFATLFLKDATLNHETWWKKSCDFPMLVESCWIIQKMDELGNNVVALWEMGLRGFAWCAWFHLRSGPSEDSPYKEASVEPIPWKDDTLNDWWRDQKLSIGLGSIWVNWQLDHWWIASIPNCACLHPHLLLLKSRIHVFAAWHRWTFPYACIFCWLTPTAICMFTVFFWLRIPSLLVCLQMWYAKWSCFGVYKMSCQITI